VHSIESTAGLGERMTRPGQGEQGTAKNYSNFDHGNSPRLPEL
jgi:hypothetical protein